jgi:hypothetical protein
MRPTNIFDEAMNHCRWKKVMENLLKDIKIENYRGKNFDEIFISIHNNFIGIKGIGMLAIYDIVSAICRYYKINIDKVYIVGKGPKRAITLLNINTKNYQIYENINLKYVEISDIINAFTMNNIEIDKQIVKTKNGDMVESYICNWQKNIN